MSIQFGLTYVNAGSDDNISGVSIFASIKVSVMAMKKVVSLFVILNRICYYVWSFLCDFM